MLFPKNIYNKLGFDQVIDFAKNHCETELGKSIHTQVKYTNQSDILFLRLEQTKEALEILENAKLNVFLPLDFDLHEKTAHIEGFFYEIESIQEISDFLVSAKKVDDFFRNNIDKKLDILGKVRVM